MRCWPADSEAASVLRDRQLIAILRERVHQRKINFSMFRDAAYFSVFFYTNLIV